MIFIGPRFFLLARCDNQVSRVGRVFFFYFYRAFEPRLQPCCLPCVKGSGGLCGAGAAFLRRCVCDATIAEVLRLFRRMRLNPAGEPPKLSVRAHFATKLFNLLFSVLIAFRFPAFPAGLDCQRFLLVFVIAADPDKAASGKSPLAGRGGRTTSQVLERAFFYINIFRIHPKRCFLTRRSRAHDLETRFHITSCENAFRDRALDCGATGNTSVLSRVGPCCAFIFVVVVRFIFKEILFESRSVGFARIRRSTLKNMNPLLVWRHCRNVRRTFWLWTRVILVVKMNHCFVFLKDGGSVSMAVVRVKFLPRQMKYVPGISRSF